MKIKSDKLADRYLKTHQVLCSVCQDNGNCYDENDEVILYAVECEKFEPENDNIVFETKKDNHRWMRV